jgi:hypothetical protein
MLFRMRLLCALLALCLCNTASAQPAPAAALNALRLTIRSERRTAGYVLLGMGLASVAAGAAIAVVGHDDRAHLAAGITTASFGAVNAALTLGLLDLSGADLRRIEAGGDFETLREAELIAHLHSGQFFAVNTGLDIFYMASGGFLCTIAAVNDQPNRWELGAGVALIVQGALLLAFDIVNWINSNERAARFRALQGKPSEPPRALPN